MSSLSRTELLRLCNRHSLAKKSVAIVKYAMDNRYDDVLVCTHDLRKMKAISAIRINDVWDRLLKHDVIGIDEGQFVSSFFELTHELI
jgi:thymidine kinase